MTRSLQIPRLSHANRDVASRLAKARRIVDVLAQAGVDLSSAAVLEIGTGSGIMASYFARRSGSLLSVDVVDERLDHSFPYQQVESETLPLPDEKFDLVISNHVIEHVVDPRLHLAEIARVLRPGGLCYMATPNRVWPIEPHFGLPLLAWLPSQWLQDIYVRVTGKGARYDVTLLTLANMRGLVSRAGLASEEAGFDVVRLVVGNKTGTDISWVKPAWPLARWMAPSLVLLLKKP